MRRPFTPPAGPVPIAPIAPGAPMLALLHDTDPARLRDRAHAWGAHRPDGTHSRSYSDGYALVGWYRGRFGVDIARVTACDERLGASIRTPRETAQGAGAEDRELISLWSGKEALARALGDGIAHDLRQLESPAGWPGGRSGEWRARALVPAPGYCAWVCWREDGAHSPR